MHKANQAIAPFCPAVSCCIVLFLLAVFSVFYCSTVDIAAAATTAPSRTSTTPAPDNRTQDTLPAWEKGVEERKKRVAAMFDESWHRWVEKQRESSTDLHPQGRDFSNASSLWLWLVEQHMKNPDARLIQLICHAPFYDDELAEIIEAGAVSDDIANGQISKWEFSKNGTKSHILMEAGERLNFFWELRYTAMTDGKHTTWGIYNSAFADKYMYSDTTEIIRIHKGKIYVVTPQPIEKEFFTNNKWKDPFDDEDLAENAPAQNRISNAEIKAQQNDIKQKIAAKKLAVNQSKSAKLNAQSAKIALNRKAASKIDAKDTRASNATIAQRDTAADFEVASIDAAKQSAPHASRAETAPVLERPAPKPHSGNATAAESNKVATQPQEKAETTLNDDFINALHPCDMEVRLNVQNDKNFPAIITASYEQTNPDHYSPAWLCTAECKITYQWNKNKYDIKERSCLHEGQWGIKQPQRK